MNIRKLKSLLWLTAFLGLLLAGWTFWDIYQGKTQEMRYESSGKEHFEQVLKRDISDNPGEFNPGPTSYAEADYKLIWNARIDGSVEPVIRTPDPGAEQNTAPVAVKLDPIEDVVRVGMLLWSSDPLYRLIALEYVNDAPTAPGASKDGGDKKRRLHLTEGEPLRAPYDAEPYFAKVLEIGQQEVTFQWGEEEVSMTPGLDSGGEGVPVDQISFPTVETVVFAEWPEETVRRDDGSYVLGTNDQDELAASGESLQSQLNVRVITPAGGGRSSLELTDVEPGSMPARFGFKTGDRIISVNGHPMTSFAEGINWGKNNPDLPQYTVLWERLGVEQTTVIHNDGK